MTAAGRPWPAGRAGREGRCWNWTQVTKEYPGQPPVRALDQVSLAVAAGELAAIVGPSGSGKSTLLHLMGTLDRPTAGTVRVTGLDVAGWRTGSCRRCERPGSGSCSSSSSSPSTRRVLGNVADGLLYAGIRRAERRRLAAAALDRVGLGHRPPPGRPSCRAASGSGSRSPGRSWRPAGGAGRRADREPGLGHRRRRCWACSRSSTRPGTTVIVITHDHAVAARMRRRIEVLDGHIVADTARPCRDRDAEGHS